MLLDFPCIIYSVPLLQVWVVLLNRTVRAAPIIRCLPQAMFTAVARKEGLLRIHRLYLILKSNDCADTIKYP